MPPSPEPLLGIPTNVITGFLGSGKTSTILNFLAQKPRGERWAVLVNEFGEIGVDGALIEGRSSGESDVFVAEVAGGCMCCSAGLPMQMTLTQLLRRARPQRLLIEPTGLGHPREVLQTLAREHFRDVLSLQKTLTLVDARNLADPRYTTHETFLQQLEIADTVVGNKEDLYGTQDVEALRAFLRKHGHPDAQLITSSHGQLPLSCLEGECGYHHASHRENPAANNDEDAAPPAPFSVAASGDDSGYRDEGFVSRGWRFGPDQLFDRGRVVEFLQQLEVERVKAVFITDQGIFGYNGNRDEVAEFELDDCTESRVELIARALDKDLEDRLRRCLRS